MLVQSLRSVIEAAAADPTTKRLAGNVEDPAALFSAENLKALESQHNGLFAFIGFIPNADADRAVADYIRQGSLGADAGDHILALFTLDSELYAPGPVGKQAFTKWVDIDDKVAPAYSFARSLFPPMKPPTLPGVVFLTSFSSATEPVFVTLTGCTSAEGVRKRCQEAFNLATAAYLGCKVSNRERFIDDFCTRLAKHGLPYQRAERTTIREHLLKLWIWSRAHSGDVAVTILRAVGPHGGPD
jgi:hypothetical protein